MSVTKIFNRLAKTNPQPVTELIFHSHFELLIAVILSAQATDASVNKATARLFKTANTPEAFLQLGITELKKHIQSIGLYHSKAKNIMATCQILSERQYPHQIPDTLEALMALPGVGRKTANVVLNCAFNKPTMPVDTHVFRVAHRLGLSDGSTPLAVEKDLLKTIPKRFLNHAHHWLILHGRYICKARKPMCPDCPVSTWCPFESKTTE